MRNVFNLRGRTASFHGIISKKNRTTQLWDVDLRGRTASFHSAREFSIVSFFDHQLLRAHIDHWFHWGYSSVKQGKRHHITQRHNPFDCWKWFSFSSVWPRNPIPPSLSLSLASGWGKLIKEASLPWVLPSHFGKYSNLSSSWSPLIAIVLLNQMPHSTTNRRHKLTRNDQLYYNFGLLFFLQKIKLARALCSNGWAR